MFWILPLGLLNGEVAAFKRSSDKNLETCFGSNRLLGDFGDEVVDNKHQETGEMLLVRLEKGKAGNLD